MKRFLTGLAIASTLSLVATSCGEEGDDELSSLETDIVETPVENERVYTQVPTPSELISFLKHSGNEYNAELVNDPEKYSQYTDLKEKVLNFGVYSTDMVYMGTYHQSTEALRYFVVLSSLADELEISSALTEDMKRQLQDYADHPDSLINVSKETYYSAYRYLEENDRGNVLALIVAGGWLESVYIATGKVTNFSPDDPTVKNIADQRLTLSNVLDFMAVHKSDPNVAATMEDLAGLLDLFYQIEEVEVAKKESNGGRMVLGGATETELLMTEDVYKQIVDKVTTLRNGITKTDA